jgi:hydroxyacylglutathione hydrolase
MILEKFLNAEAPATYLIGSGNIGLIIDPGRDVNNYLERARYHGMDIKYVLKTQRHAGGLIGSHLLKTTKGAKLVGGSHALFSHCDIQLKEGESFEAGGITFRAIFTDEHVPFINYAAFLEGQNQCWAIFSSKGPVTH